MYGSFAEAPMTLFRKGRKETRERKRDSLVCWNIASEIVGALVS
jgi:hypothetical protein